MLKINNLHVSVADKPILKGLTLEVPAGEVDDGGLLLDDLDGEAVGGQLGGGASGAEADDEDFFGAWAGGADEGDQRVAGERGADEGDGALDHAVDAEEAQAVLLLDADEAVLALGLGDHAGRE